MTIKEIVSRHENVTIKETNDEYIVTRNVIADIKEDNGAITRNKHIQIVMNLNKNEYNLLDVENYIIGGTERMNYEKYFANGTVSQITYKRENPY